MKPLTFVTGNPNKVIEVNAIIGDTIPLQSRALDIPEIQGTLEDIARDKCRRAARIVGNLQPLDGKLALTKLEIRSMGRYLLKTRPWSFEP
jgi:inosine/xanthosine triphosphate pyrophosphatase family protein